MAAFDIGPWDTDIPQETPLKHEAEPRHSSMTSEPSTYAAFSPSSTVHASPFSQQRSTILIHKKSPLLIATPPQVTRALAYSHAFVIPLNKLVGLISWTTGNFWESFLLLCCFWGLCLYGDIIIRFSWPLVLTASLTAGLYLRRFSPLSSTEWSKSGKGSSSKKESDQFGHAKSLEEIVETLKEFTARCNILLDPFLRMTNFLSTQVTATSATTRPALTALFMRVLIITPLWFILTLPPFSIITSRRVIITTGTIILSWHARAARVSRTILWRSRTIRQISTTLTGLPLTDRPKRVPSGLHLSGMRTVGEIAAALSATRNNKTPGALKKGNDAIRFTFVLYENQRRWIGLGWTGSMLAYERASWTDEQLNPAPPLKKFELPEVEGGLAKWRWCEDSEWQVEGTEEEDNPPTADGRTKPKTGKKSATGDGGWIYYDNKWQGGERGKDSWAKYTRRRKWYRDAELVEIDSGEPALTSGAKDIAGLSLTPNGDAGDDTTTAGTRTPVSHEKSQSLDSRFNDDAMSKRSASPSKSSYNRKSGSWFGRRKRADSFNSTASGASSSFSRGVGSPKKREGFLDEDSSNEGGAFTFAVDREAEDRNEDSFVPLHLRGRQGAVEANWGVGDEVGMDLG